MKLRYLVGLLTIMISVSSILGQTVENDAYWGTGKTFGDLRNATLLGGVCGEWLVSRFEADPTNFDAFKWFPAYQWSFGCTPTSYSMVAAYWALFYGFKLGPDVIHPNNLGQDWGPLPNLDIKMYSVRVKDPSDPNNPAKYTYETKVSGNCPISATRKGLVALAENGHVDQFWAYYHDANGNSGIIKDLSAKEAGRLEGGVWGFFKTQVKDCIADWMETSKGDDVDNNGGTKCELPDVLGSKNTSLSKETLGFFKYIKSYSGKEIDIISQRGDFSDLTKDEVLYVMGETKKYGDAATEFYNKTQQNSGVTFDDIKESINKGIPVIINTILTLPNNSDGSNWRRPQRKHTMVVIGYWPDGDLYIRTTDEKDEQARLKQYRLASKVSSINYKTGDDGVKNVRWVINKVVFFDGLDIQRDKYSIGNFSSNEVLPKNRGENRVDKAFDLIDLTQPSIATVNIDDEDFADGDYTECKLYVKRAVGEMKQVYAVEKTISQNKTLDFTVPAFDFTIEGSNWVYAKNTDYVEGLWLIKKRRVEAIVDADTIYRKFAFTKRVLLKHNVNITLPSIEIHAEVFDIGDTLQGVTFSIANNGGPLREHTVGTLWEFGDGNGDVSPIATHVYQKTGTYDVKLRVTGLDGIPYTATKTVVVDKGITSVLDKKFTELSKNSIAVNNATLSINMEQKGNLSVDVYNMLGRVVNSVDYGTITKGLHKVDFSKDGNLAAGAYLLKITAGEEVLNTKALIY